MTLNTAAFSTTRPIRALIQPDSVILQRQRRATRTKTLDGNAAIVDYGFSIQDATLRLNFQLANPPAVFLELKRLAGLGSLITVSLPGVAYSAMIYEYAFGVSNSFTLYVREQLTE